MNDVTRPLNYSRQSANGPPKALRRKLSRRQCEVAILVADGFSNKQIGAKLGLSLETIRAYTKRIATRLQLDRSRGLRPQITTVVIHAWAEDEAA